MDFVDVEIGFNEAIYACEMCEVWCNVDRRSQYHFRKRTKQHPVWTAAILY